MTWEDARYFLAANRNGTLAGAARELECEHPTVVRRLDALESALGVRLFERTPEGITATDVAADLAPLAEAIERSVQAFERRAAGHDDAVDGNVRPTTTEALGPVLVERLGELRERHGALDLEGIADNRVLDVSRGEADITRRFSPSAHSGAATIAFSCTPIARRSPACAQPWISSRR